MSQLMPLLAAQQHLNDLDSKSMIVVANEAIQQEQLTHSIREPQRLDEHVQNDEIISKSFTGPKAYGT